MSLKKATMMTRRATRLNLLTSDALSSAAHDLLTSDALSSAAHMGLRSGAVVDGRRDNDMDGKHLQMAHRAALPRPAMLTDRPGTPTTVQLVSPLGPTGPRIFSPIFSRGMMQHWI